MDLSGEEFKDYTQKAKSLGTMPRISHMVEVIESAEVNDQLKDALMRADDIVNKS